jgi:hypothetical protein
LEAFFFLALGTFLGHVEVGIVGPGLKFDVIGVASGAGVHQAAAFASDDLIELSDARGEDDFGVVDAADVAEHLMNRLPFENAGCHDR